MADVVIDYELLNRLGKETLSLRNKLSDVRQENHNYTADQVGSRELGLSLDWYYMAWSGAFKHAWDLLTSLSDTYTTTAQQWFDQDAGYAATANEQAAGFTHGIWQMQKSAYDSWQKLSHTYVPSHGFDKDGNPYDTTVPLADPNAPPQQPGAEPTGYSWTGSDGSTHSTTSTYDDQGNLTGNDTTITDGSGGLSYHEKTTFGDNGSYTSSVNYADGSSATETVAGNADGSGTRTDVTTNPDGSKTTTTYTGTGVNGAHPVWTQNSTDGDDDNGDSQDNHPDKGGDHSPYYVK